ncbi:MAG: excinuclease ABC subunit UvrC [Oscillospiraceae bacterium]|jgi:excinuclease ABC subunit C|nr:excinuclease ABC subunit UvrC [Oscillospiraceae bacterium]
MNLQLPELRKKAMALPLLPGVYLMKDSKGGVIYVGKAKVLKNRVSQYFGSPTNHDEKVRAMVERVAAFDYIVVDSEFEALVLECSLIKQHAPKYNILLKDDKGYRYIRCTGGAWPVLSVAKQKHEDGAEYLGPYTNGYAVNPVMEEVRQIFRLPDCSKCFPRDVGKGRPCLRYFIELCAAPCARKISREAYAQSVADAVEYIRRGSSQSIVLLRAEMEQAAEALDFERAARLRDRIKAMEALREKQHVVSITVEEQDVFALAAEQSQACWAVLRFRGGRLAESEHFFLERPESFPEARQELLERYYAMRGEDLPRRVLLDDEATGMELLAQWLGAQAGHRVPVQTAQRGEPLRLVELCRKNALEKLAQRTGRQSKSIAGLEELASLLGLPAPPEYIEAYDISHTGGSDNVAGMVVFQGGTPLKAAYKRFAIKSFTGQDDYASMAEVLTRRFSRWQEEKETGEGFGRLPDLILLDGGIGQVHAVEPVLHAFGLTVPLFGMVKDGRHRTRAIASGGGEIAFNATRQAFALVTTIQDEVHRFAVAYHHQKHQKRSLSSALTEIPGIGETRAKNLLREFKTMKAIGEADEATLAKAKGMNAAAAKAVYAAMHSG